MVAATCIDLANNIENDILLTLNYNNEKKEEVSKPKILEENHYRSIKKSQK